MEQTYYLFSC